MPREESPFQLKVRSFFDVNKVYFFIAISLIQFLFLFIQKEFVTDEIAAIKFMPGSQSLVFTIFQGFEMLIVPFALAWQFTIVGFVLWVGCFLWGYKVTYNKCWQIAMIGSTIFFIPDILTILWFVFIQTDPTIWDVRAFSPLSIMNFFDHELLDRKYWKAYKDLNLFEVTYWIVLVYGVDFAARKKRSIAYAIVFTTYVPLFLLWLWFYVGVYD